MPKPELTDITECERCGGPPTDRDKGGLQKWRGAWSCSTCIMDGSDKKLTMTEYLVTRGDKTSLLGASEEYIPKGASFTLKERDKINEVARECGVLLTRDDFRNGQMK